VFWNLYDREKSVTTFLKCYSNGDEPAAARDEPAPARDEPEPGDEPGSGRGDGVPPVRDQDGGGVRSPTYLSFLYLNAQSIASKLDELTCTANDLQPDLIFITESWCNENVTNAFLAIPGYELATDLPYYP
jgi:hypothetical protein